MQVFAQPERQPKVTGSKTKQPSKNRVPEYNGRKAIEFIRVRGLSPNGLLLPWALVLGPGTAKLFVFFSFFWVGSVLRNRNSSEKAPAAMSHW